MPTAGQPQRRISVVIVTWNSEQVIGGCLRSLAESAASSELELFVVDNDSRDGTVDAVFDACPTARLIRNPTNRGLAAANNQGLSLATGDPILICNPDVVFRRGAVDSMTSVFDRRPRAGWVVPQLLYEDGSIQTSVGDMPNLLDTILGRQLSRYRRAGTDSGFWWDEWGHDEERPVGRGHEAAYMIRRAALDEVGLQDERYVLDWEGLDWASRFHSAGWEVWLSPAAGVVHLGGASIRQVQYRWIASCHRGMYLYFSDRRGRGWRPVLAAVFGARALTKMGLVAAKVPMYQWSHRDPRRRSEQDRPPAN